MIFDEDAIEHHGIKGMKWGVRKKRETSGDDEKMSPELEQLIKSTPTKPLTPAERNRIADSEAKHADRFAPSEANSPKGWRPTRKQLVVAAAGTVVLAGVAYKLKTGKKLPSASGFSLSDYTSAAREAETPDWLKQYAGKHMSVADFKGISETSKGRVWAGNYITKDSFAQKEMTLQAGHEFFRVSHRAEQSFNTHTFATASKEDAARYFLGWKDQTTNLISFKAKDKVKIPDLHTTLEAVREQMIAEGHNPKPEDVIRQLDMFTGSDWTAPRGREIAKRLIAKGYHGVIDHMDAGVYGEAPMVLFDSAKFTPKVTTLREHVDIEGMKKILVDLPNRR